MVLLIDDDPTLAPLVTGMLSAGGEGALDVTSAGTLGDGLRLLRDAEHCVILLDLRLPDSDGLRTLAACTAARPAGTPIIVLTAEGDRALAVAALREGADDFLLKTELTPSMLARAIRYAIERAAHRVALRAAELRASVVIESIDSMIGVVDDGGELLQVNSAWRSFAAAAACPVLGATIGTNFFAHCDDLKHPFGELLVDRVRGMLERGDARFEETVHGITCSGREVTLRVRGAVVELPSRKGAAVVIDDLTEKVQFERKLNAYAERMALALDAGQVGTWDWDLKSGHIEWSPWHFRIFGREQGDFDGSFDGFLRSVHPEERDSLVRQVESLRTSRATYRNTHRIVRPDGAVRWIEAQGRFFFNDAGEPTRMCGALVDVTERHLASARHILSQRLEALGELSAGISHDLRNTLTLANSSLAALDTLPGLDERARAALADLRLATTQAGQLAGSLLAFAQPQRRNLSETADLSEVCMGFVAFLRRLLPQRLRLVAECGPDPATVLIAPVYVQQILMNLVLNARDALGGEGEIHVRVTPGEQYHLLEVSDNGPGIPPAVQAHLFEPFYTAKAEGSGLGLTIVKTILDGTSGAIEVDSSPGRGASFRVRWPVARVSSSLQPGSPLRAPLGGQLAAVDVEAKAKPTIAIIQTADYARRILADGLDEAGFAVFETDEFGAAERAIERGDVRPAVLVVDDALLQGTGEQSDGSELCRRKGIARLRRSGSMAPVILITAGDTDDGDDYLTIAKPFSVGQVCAAVRAMLEDDSTDFASGEITPQRGTPGGDAATDGEPGPETEGGVP